MTLYTDCDTCHGTGLITVDWGDAPCPGCRLWSRRDNELLHAANRAAQEDAYRAEGFDDMDPLEQWAADGNR